jgi:hypothetical protein
VDQRWVKTDVSENCFVYIIKVGGAYIRMIKFTGAAFLGM